MIVWLSDYTSNSPSTVEQKGTRLVLEFGANEYPRIRRLSAHNSLQHITVYVFLSLLLIV